MLLSFRSSYTVGLTCFHQLNTFSRMPVLHFNIRIFLLKFQVYYLLLQSSLSCCPRSLFSITWHLWHYFHHLSTLTLPFVLGGFRFLQTSQDVSVTADDSILYLKHLLQSCFHFTASCSLSFQPNECLPAHFGYRSAIHKLKFFLFENLFPLQFSKNVFFYGILGWVRVKGKSPQFNQDWAESGPVCRLS